MNYNEFESFVKKIYEVMLYNITTTCPICGHDHMAIDWDNEWTVENRKEIFKILEDEEKK